MGGVAPWPLLGAERQIRKASPPAWAGPSYPGVEIGRILEEVQMTPVLPAGVVTLGPAGTACRTGEFAAWRKVDSDVDSLLFRGKPDLCDPPGFLEPKASWTNRLSSNHLASSFSVTSILPHCPQQTATRAPNIWF